MSLSDTSPKDERFNPWKCERGFAETRYCWNDDTYSAVIYEYRWYPLISLWVTRTINGNRQDLAMIQEAASTIAAAVDEAVRLIQEDENKRKLYAGIERLLDGYRRV